MSQIFDIFVRSYEDDSPVATLTIGLDLNSSLAADNDNKDDIISENNSSNQSSSDPDIQNQVKRRSLANQNKANQTMVFDIKEMIYTSAMPEYQILPERQSIFYQGVKLELDHKTLADHDIKQGATIHMRDDGYLIPSRLGKFLTYSGPIAIWWGFQNKHQEVYRFIMGDQYLEQHYEILFDYQEGQTQRLASFLIFVHFIKCILESIFVHRHTGKMISLNRVMWQILYYWVALGAVAFTLYDPEYSGATYFTNLSQQSQSYFSYIVVALFFVAEYSNLRCHLHYLDMESKLANEYNRQKPNNVDGDELMSRARRSYMISSISKFVILKDFGFQFATCADYFWETIAWIAISLLIQTAASYSFVIVFIVWKNSKARERHNRYTCEYRYQYPQERRAYIPFLV